MIVLLGASGGFPARSRAQESRAAGAATCDLPPAFLEFDADAVGHDWSNVYLLAYLSTFIYKFDVPEADFEDVFKARIAGLGLEFVDYISKPFDIGLQGDTQLAVVQTDDAIIFAFRGTDPFTSADLWWTDVQIFTYQGIHLGFHAATESVFPEIRTHIENSGNRRVWLTGHSLGGALAVVTALKIGSKAPHLLPRVQGIYTYGSPRALATTALDDAVGLYETFYADAQTQRWVDNRDLVPHLPPTSVPPDIFYSHVGEAVWIREAGTGGCTVDFTNGPLGGISISDHMPDRYLLRIYNSLPASLRPLMPTPPPVQSGALELSCDLPPEIASSSLWVDFVTCTPDLTWQCGALSLPFCTLQAGVDAAPPGSCINIKAGSSSESLTLTKSLELRAYGGTALIGVH